MVSTALFLSLVVGISAAALEHVLDEVTFVLNISDRGSLRQALADRSTPGSPLYQKWLSREQVDNMSRCWESADAVIKWAAEHKFRVTDLSTMGCHVCVQLPLRRWSDVAHGCGRTKEDSALDVPALLRDHVSFMVTSSLTTKAVPAALQSQESQQMRATSDVTLDVLRKVYDVPQQRIQHRGNDSRPLSPPSVVVYEAAQQYFSPDDLTIFQDLYSLPHTSVQHPHGYSTTDCVSHSCAEGNLLTQYITGLAPGAAVEYHYLRGNPFAAWILEAMDTTQPAPVQVISFLAMEQAIDPAILDAFNTEALRLALMGVTIIVPAGDNGVASFPDRCDAASGSADQGHWKGASGWTGKGYFPSFPATSPYVTAVGATQGPEDGNPEIACQSQLGGVITTGGGFSTYFPTPSWQQTALGGYLTFLQPDQTPSPGYNSLGRGLPDVALLGAHYAVVVEGEQRLVSSSAASAAVFAAMVARINAARMADNKTTVGYINPTLYSAHRDGERDSSGGEPQFRDIVSGDNKCLAVTTDGGDNVSHPVCCASGFYATAGWDPVTGLGSVQYRALTSLFGVGASAGAASGRSSGALTVGAIVGIAIGGFCAVAIAVAVIVSVCIARARASMQEEVTRL